MNALREHLHYHGLAYLAGFGFVALIFFIVGLFILEEQRWDNFRTAHHCREVAQIDGSLFNTYTVDSQGNFSVGIGSTGSKKGWLCDDGVTYYRSE